MYPAGPDEDLGTEGSAPIDFSVLLGRLLRRWKLIAVATVLALVATYGVVRLLPLSYKSTVEILVYDPQRQIDSAVQKPISPFVDAIGFDAINTEISIIKSKSVALRVARELRLDKDPEFQPHSILADVLGRLGLSHLTRAADADNQAPQASEAEKLDQAADVLLANLEAWPNSYIISITAAAQSARKSQLLAKTIATDYLANQREARQDALEHVAAWLKGRVDNIHSRVLETEATIERLRVASGIRDTESNLVRAQQVGELNAQLMAAREDVDQKRARLEQAHRIVDRNGDVQSIAELAASPTLTALRQRQIEVSARTDELQRKLGDSHQQVIASRAALAAINKQISMETAHILGAVQNDYDVAKLKAQSLEASLGRLTVHVSPEVDTRLRQLRRLADADHSLYESYLSQYNEISERRTLQDASARIISPATLPKSASSSRHKLFYGLGGGLGLGAGILLALLLEYRQRGFKTREEVESFFGRPVLGTIPLGREQKPRRNRSRRAFEARDAEARWYLNDSIHSLRISLELLSANPKVVLVTSALPGEGKSTAAKLLAASSASAGRRTLLLECDLYHEPPAPGASVRIGQPGLSDVLRMEAKLPDVIVRDPVAKHYVIAAGSLALNPADWLLSKRMREIIDQLRNEFDYIVMDAPPLLPVVDALALSTLADKVLFVVAWGETPRASIAEAIKVLRPEAHRVAGFVLNKIDPDQVPQHVYGRYRYGPVPSA